jgi:hypothetical protein
MGEHRPRSAKRIVCAKDHSTHSVQEQRSQTHNTRLQSGVTGHFTATLPELRRHLPKRLDLRMTTRMKDRLKDHAFSFCNHGIVKNNDCSNGQIAFLLRSQSALDCSLQMSNVHALFFFCFNPL